MRGSTLPAVSCSTSALKSLIISSFAEHVAHAYGINRLASMAETVRVRGGTAVGRAVEYGNKQADLAVPIPSWPGMSRPSPPAVEAQMAGTRPIAIRKATAEKRLSPYRHGP